MHNDLILNNLAFITIFFIVAEAALLIYTNNAYNNQKHRKVIHEGSFLKDPVLNQDFSKPNNLYKRLLIIDGVLLAVILFWTQLLNNSEITDSSLNVIKFSFGMIVFPTLYNIFICVSRLFQIMHLDTDQLVKGTITYTSAYSLKLRAFHELYLVLVFSFFAFFSQSAYLWGGAAMFVVLSLRDYFSSKKILETANEPES